MWGKKTTNDIILKQWKLQSSTNALTKDLQT
jgi:hypothetical protein